MPRTKEFDPERALQSALELFWARGYERTSTADLVEHLGIARASLYATFGSKHELYLRALDRYRGEMDPRVIELLSRPGPALPAVRELIGIYARQASGPDGGTGCLIVNAAVERAPDDPQATQRVEASWTALEVALSSALMRAQAQGELAADRDPRALARFVLVLLQGIRVVGKARSDPQRVRDAAAAALDVLG